LIGVKGCLAGLPARYTGWQDALAAIISKPQKAELRRFCLSCSVLGARGWSWLLDEESAHIWVLRCGAREMQAKADLVVVLAGMGRCCAARRLRRPIFRC